MLKNKTIDRVAAAGITLAAAFCLLAMVFSDAIAEAFGGAGVSMEYETELFDTSEIIEIDIAMDEDDWAEMLENATSEEYYECDVTINGTTFYRVGIRPKGNTSLTSIANDPDTDRYSFKLEFDQYVDGQTCWGLDKLVLNNNYADATNMKEALTYDMFQFLGADASLYNYAEISVNGEYWGVYLALEAVEDSFMLRNYGVSDGELYKPEGMDGGGGGFLPIDTPFSGTDFFDALLENEEYLEQYHAYYRQLVEEYVDGGRLEETYNRICSQIDSLVETDPTAFYSYEEYEAAAEMLYDTILLRAESVEGQRADSSALLDASSIDLSVMGSMMGGGGGQMEERQPGDEPGAAPAENGQAEEESGPAGEDALSTAFTAESSSAMPLSAAASEPAESAPSDADGEQTPPDNAGTTPEDAGTAPEDAAPPDSGQSESGGSGSDAGSSAVLQNAVWYSGCLLLLVIALLIAGVYRRRPKIRHRRNRQKALPPGT